ncbi:MAG: TetR family transcriptional regulator C-terminal domain-containing protein [Acidocella sp.]|nr:TetR family transcriptional regulator C-terminal domain-containing protein [Acidocella sp.]
MVEGPVTDEAVRPAGQVRRARVGRILKAAERLFAANGFEGTTTADIAALAKLPKANVYYYFPTKEKLYLAVLDRILDLWLGEADIWIVPSRGPREALTNYIRAKIDLAREHPEASRIYASELLRGAPHLTGYLHITLRNRVMVLGKVIDGWVAQGLMHPVDPVHLLSCIWAMTQTYADFAVQIAAISGKMTLDDDVFVRATHIVTRMVTAAFVVEAG